MDYSFSELLSFEKKRKSKAEKRAVEEKLKEIIGEFIISGNKQKTLMRLNGLRRGYGDQKIKKKINFVILRFKKIKGRRLI